MRTLAALPPHKRVFKSRETMDVYAPLADRLGISSIKWELEDLAFFYLEPEEYERVARMVQDSREQRERDTDEAIKTLSDELHRVGVENFQVVGRTQAPVVHLPEDAAQGHGVHRDLRPHRPARHHPDGGGLLFDARRRALALASACPGALRTT